MVKKGRSAVPARRPRPARPNWWSRRPTSPPPRPRYERLRSRPSKGTSRRPKRPWRRQGPISVDAEVGYRRSEALFERQGRSGPGSRPRSLCLSRQQSHPHADGSRPQAAQGHLGEGQGGVPRGRRCRPEARSRALKINLERLVVRALVDGEVLQVHVRPGQYAGLVWNEPLIVLGDIHELHVRVDIDEQDLPVLRDELPGGRDVERAPAGAIPAHLLRHRALRHPQAEPHRLEHRASRYSGPPGSLTPCPITPPSRCTSGSRWTSTSKPSSLPRGLCSTPTP